MHLTLLLFWIGVCFTVAGVSGWWTAGEVTGWYRTLKRPVFTPPTWVFGPVWTLLYTLMALAAWQVSLSAPSPLRTRGLTLFLVQLGLNLAWSWMFFHEHEIGTALMQGILMWVAIGATILVFSGVVPVAAWLMVPYWAWVSFAAVLNAEFWRLN
jgi:tryptophan-rich sensory protein